MGLKAIYSLFRQDLTNALRDNIILYMIVAPILLAIGARVLLPSLEVSTLQFATETALSEEMLTDLRQLGDVELFDTPEAVQERVERSDDVFGIAVVDDEFVVVLEGNEPEGETTANLIMSTLLKDEATASIYHEQLDEAGSRLTEYAAVILAMIAVMMGGMSAGFIMVDEKESKAVRALAVSPLTMTQYTIARGFFAVMISTVVAMIGSAILMGTTINYAQLAIACLIASGVGLVLGYVVGGFANNQFEAMALIKVVSFLFLTVPILSIFIPENWQLLLAWLPNYWMFKMFENLFVGQIGPVGFWGVCALTLIVSALYLAGMFPRLRSKMRLRYA